MNQPGALNEKYKKVFVVLQKQKSKELLYFYHEIEISEFFLYSIKTEILGHQIKKIK